MDSVRLDIWLWSVRLTPTRSAATDLCRTGRVVVNGKAAKSAYAVKVGDRIEARIAQRQRIVEVVELINKRVGAPRAAECLIDLSPPVERLDISILQRDRRQIDQLRRGDS